MDSLSKLGRKTHLNKVATMQRKFFKRRTGSLETVTIKTQILNVPQLGVHEIMKLAFRRIRQKMPTYRAHEQFSPKTTHLVGVETTVMFLHLSFVTTESFLFSIVVQNSSIFQFLMDQAFIS